MHKTLVVHNRYAWRSYRTHAAINGNQGARLLTIEQLAARLAGGFLQPINPDTLNEAVASAIAQPLGKLDKIKGLPGFQRATASSLTKAWSAGLSLEDLEKEAAKAGKTDSAVDATARSRLKSFAVLEKEVLAQLPDNQLRPRDLVSRASTRAEHAPMIFGPIEIHGRTEMSPVWRPLLSQIAKHTKVVWVANARQVPEWLSDAGVPVKKSMPTQPAFQTFSCASPRHEVLAAFRWARQHLANGATPQEIAIVTAAPESWDDHVLALMESANLPLHFIHGRSAFSTSQGQLVAALAEILLRGFSRARIVRLVALLRFHTNTFRSLPSSWWRALPSDAPLLDAVRWRRAFKDLTPENLSDDKEHKPLLDEMIETLGKGLSASDEIGEALLNGKALALWRTALTEGPTHALDVTLASLRIDDGVEPEAAIVWGPASAIAAMPRPLTWLVGLTSQAWPRHAVEDPLLPAHIVKPTRLDPLPVHNADRRDFQTILAMTERELVCSRARRNNEGRRNGVSPLFPSNATEVYLVQSQEPEHAASASDRLLARPKEFRQMPHAKSAHQAWKDWHRKEITAHDGLVRDNHPLLLRALDRRQSATSLVKLLCDPLGYLWSYGFKWTEPAETDEPLTLDALAFGRLLHEMLAEAVTQIEGTGAGRLGSASNKVIVQAITRAEEIVGKLWDETRPVPPPVIWQIKLAEAAQLATVALSHPEDPLSGQRSWAEIPFGGDQKVASLSEEARLSLPWDPMAKVSIPGTAIHIGGSIDRLDLAGDESVARVTDYKSGQPPREAPQLKGGTELQRCLYACAVKALVTSKPAVESRLLYPRADARLLRLNDLKGTLAKLAKSLVAAVASFAEGKALSGPAAEGNDLAFALPGDAKERYLRIKLPLATQALSNVEPIWGEP